MEDVIADGLSQPLILPKLEQAYGTSFLMISLPICLLGKLELGHEVIEVLYIVSLRPASPGASSSPFEDEDPDCYQKYQQKNAPDYEEKFDEEIPEVYQVDLQLQSERDFAIGHQFDTKDEALGLLIGLFFKEYQWGGKLHASLSNLPALSSRECIASIQYIDIALIFPDIDGLVIGAGGGMADLKDEDDV